MDNNTYEQKLDLKDLMFFVFRKWRPILLAAFVFAILLGGYKSGKAFMSQKNEEFILNLKDEYENNLEKYRHAKTRYELDIENLTASIKYQERYKENSLLLKIDPYRKGVSTVDIFVKIPELLQSGERAVATVDYTDSIVKAYGSAIQNGVFLEGLSKEKGIDLIYLNELITVTEDYSSNMVNVSVISAEEEGAEEILNKILENIESISTPIQENLGQHSITIMNRSTGFSTDLTDYQQQKVNDFANYQQQKINGLADYQQQKIKDLADTNKSLEDTENALRGLNEPKQLIAVSRSLILKEGIKYTFLGGVAGAFLTIFGICVIFLVNGKLKIDSDLKEQFGIKILGGFTEVKKKKIFSCIDCWLDQLEGKKDVSSEFIYDMVAANISNFVDTGEAVFMTGTVSEDVLRKLEIQLKKRLPQLRIGVGSDMTKNVSTLQKLPEYNEVILVEARNKSRYRDIEKEIEMLLDFKKNILGYIVLNSNESCVES